MRSRGWLLWCSTCLAGKLVGGPVWLLLIPRLDSSFQQMHPLIKFPIFCLVLLSSADSLNSVGCRWQFSNSLPINLVFLWRTFLCHLLSQCSDYVGTLASSRGTRESSHCHYELLMCWFGPLWWSLHHLWIVGPPLVWPPAAFWSDHSCPSCPNFEHRHAGQL